MKLVTDRTEADVLLGNEKGRYSYADLNRVEQAVAELHSIAQQLGMELPITTKTDWGRPGTFPEGWMTENQALRYLGNVRALCSRFAVAMALPETMSRLNHRSANAIEQALETVYCHMEAMTQSLAYSGQLYAGKEHVL